MFSPFGALLQTLRTRRRLSQQALASALGVHRNTIGNWERGNKLPDSKTMVLELARQLHLDEAETRQLLEASLTAPMLFWHVPYPRNPCFTGREAILQALHTRLESSQAVALTQSYALSGLGGVGKTQLALEYAYRHALEYHAVLWLAAESRESLMTSWQQIAAVLQLPEGKQADQERLMAAVQRWLTTHSNWLLIWDNVEDLELLAHFLSPVRQGVQLLTTRCAALGTLAEGCEVPLMSHEEGLVLLLRRAKVLRLFDSTEQLPPIAARHSSEYAAAEDLVRLLEGLPLALDQAGAYVEETAGSLADYLRLYHTHRADLLSRRGDVASAHPASVVTTWSVAFERLEQAHPAAADLLRLCALLAPDAIPEELFTQGAAHLGERLGPVAADPLQWPEALRAVLAYSLLHRNSEDHTLSMHRLVQAVLRDQMDVDSAQHWRERAVRALNGVFPDTGRWDVVTWPHCERYLLHAQACRQWLNLIGSTWPEPAALCSKAGSYLRERGRYGEAEPFLGQALALQEQRWGAEHPAVADALEELGDLSTRQAQYQRAEPLLQRALAIREQQLGMTHPQTAESLNDLGLLYWTQAKYEQAEPLCVQALTLRERHFGEMHLQTAESLNNVGMLYWAQGKYQQAEPLLHRAMVIREEQLGPEHPQTANSLVNLGTLYDDQGRYEKAEPLLQRAVAIHKQQLGPEHPHLARIMRMLGVLHLHRGKYQLAEPLCARALSICEQQLGPDHPETAFSLMDLGRLYQQQGKWEGALPLLQRTVEILEQQLGPENSDTAWTFQLLGALYREQGQEERAEPLLQRALAVCERQLGERHPWTVRCLREIARLAQQQGKQDQAEGFYQRACLLFEEQLGKDHPETANTLTSLATLYWEQERYAQAEQLYQRALAIDEERLGQSHPDTAMNLLGLALLDQQQGESERAERRYQQALAIYEQALGAEHPTVVAALAQYALLLQHLHREEEAAALHARAQAIHTQQIPQRWALPQERSLIESPKSAKRDIEE